MLKKSHTHDFQDTLFSDHKLTVWLIPFLAGMILGMFIGAFLVLV